VTLRENDKDIRRNAPSRPLRASPDLRIFADSDGYRNKAALEGVDRCMR